MCLTGAGKILIPLAFTVVPDKDIDDDILNMKLYGKTLKDHLDYYYYGRKTWLTIYSIIIFLECIIQMILVIIYNYRNNYKPANKRDIIKTSDMSSSPKQKDL